MIRVFVDDSEVNVAPVYVLAGWIARDEEWIAFSRDWDDALRMSPRIAYFKYAEAISLTGEFHGISERSRDEKITLLLRTIEDHKLLGIASIIPDFVFKGLFGPNVQGALNHPYLSMVHAIIHRTISHFESVDVREPIDFVFDEQPGQGHKVLESWGIFLETCPPAFRQYLQRPPIFRDDKSNPPLQAADLHAGWVRELNAAELLGKPTPQPLWGGRGATLKRLNHVWTPELAESLFEKLFGYPPVRVRAGLQATWRVSVHEES